MNEEQFKQLMNKQNPTQQDIQQFRELLTDQDHDFLAYIAQDGPIDEDTLLNNLTFLKSQEHVREYISYYEPLLTQRANPEGNGQQISIDPAKADLLTFLFE